MSMCEVDGPKEGKVAGHQSLEGLPRGYPLETRLWSPPALNSTPEAGDTTQQLRACAALAEDPNSVPSSHTGWLTISQGSDASGLCVHPPSTYPAI